MAGTSSRSSRFDTEAAGFDRRAGVPSEAGTQIAAAVIEGASGHVVFELGAGTGEVGRALAVLADRYVGVDVSGPMLSVFQDKLTSSDGLVLVQADGDRYWPVCDGSVSVVFASRVAHLLDAAHVVREATRVCRPGGRFVVGRIERSGVKQELRRQRETMLADRGIAKRRSGGRRTRALLEAFLAAGAVAEPMRAVAAWTVTIRPAEIIAGWETMSRVGGEAVAPAINAELLSELRQWARGQFGDLEERQESHESYTLEGVRLG